MTDQMFLRLAVLFLQACQLCPRTRSPGSTRSQGDSEKLMQDIAARFRVMGSTIHPEPSCHIFNSSTIRFLPFLTKHAVVIRIVAASLAPRSMAILSPKRWMTARQINMIVDRHTPDVVVRKSIAWRKVIDEEKARIVHACRHLADDCRQMLLFLIAGLDNKIKDDLSLQLGIGVVLLFMSLSKKASKNGNLFPEPRLLGIQSAKDKFRDILSLSSPSKKLYNYQRLALMISRESMSSWYNTYTTRDVVTAALPSKVEFSESYTGIPSKCGRQELSHLERLRLVCNTEP
ncbi:hypothetical protein ARMSODRAFT_980852 [Armillaria solidipes]|uniref:Uncharacterized protein n=1 Tax=Armillaria solidipes TaxID=1076256 RepID=A0A2H3AU58_9AGAR|nr:hypothetical protein ARMSODRAFT_980852 [Armillaria solidipes]